MAENQDNLNNSIDPEMDDDKGLNTSLNETDIKKRRTETPSPNPTPMPGFMVPASPPKFLSFEQLMAAANGVKNMSLAHEIAVNNDFQLEKLQPEKSSIEQQVRDVMHKAFWDALEEKLGQDPPDYSHALVLIEEVKESLLSLLLPQHVRLRAQVLEVLDMDLIRQKMENGAFDIFFYSNYVIGTLTRLCAPARDGRVAALKELHDVVPLFKEIFEVLDLMKMDMANFTIQQVRPYLQQQSVEYERKKFNEFIKTQEENNCDGLECTRMWLKRNFQKLLLAEKEALEKSGTSSPSSPAVSEASQTSQKAPAPESPLPQSSSGSSTSKATPANILNEAYIETLHWDHKNIYPETLLLDKIRFCEMEAKCRLMTTIAAVQLVTYSTVGSPISGVSALKATLKSHVKTLLEAESVDLKTALAGVADQVKKDVNECLVELAFAPMDAQKEESLRGQICDLAQPTNKVLQIMSARLKVFIGESISTRRMDPLKVPAGFSAVETELSQLLGQFLRLISHNRSVFGPHYSAIISPLLERQQDLSPR